MMLNETSGEVELAAVIGHAAVADGAGTSGVVVLVAATVMIWVGLRRVADRQGQARQRRYAQGWAALQLKPWAAVAVAGIGFQVMHFVEHLLQVTYWVVHPDQAPWLTPWGAVARDGLASLTDGTAGTGNELLHLLGNLVFLAGLVAARLFAGGYSGARAGDGRLWLSRALWVQGLHVAEHVALTVSWVAGGQAVGASNVLGLLEPGTPLAFGVRVWVHFTVNLVATLLAVRAVETVLGPMLRGRRSKPPERLTDRISGQPDAAPHQAAHVVASTPVTNGNTWAGTDAVRELMQADPAVVPIVVHQRAVCTTQSGAGQRPNIT